MIFPPSYHKRGTLSIELHAVGLENPHGLCYNRNGSFRQEFERVIRVKKVIGIAPASRARQGDRAARLLSPPPNAEGSDPRHRQRVGHTGDGMVEGTEYGDHILGVQGHPEIDGLPPELFAFLTED